MNGLFLVFTLLGQDPPLTPPPPPPVVAPEDPSRVPLPPPPPMPAPEPGVQPVVTEPAAPMEDEGPGIGVRIPAAIGIAGIGGGATIAGMYFVSTCRGNAFGAGTECVLAGMAVAALGAGGVVAGGFGGHRLFGGKSNLGWAILGMGAGAVIGFVGYYLAIGLTRNTSLPGWAPVVPSAVLACIGAGTMVEVGNALMVRELRRKGQLTMIPMLLPGGGALALGGTF